MSECSVDGFPISGLARLTEKAAQRNVPLQALFELTGRCHMDCVHCYLDIKNPAKNELSTEEVVGVLDALQAEGTLFLTLTGGEIFLRKDIFEIMGEAKKRHFALRLFTSGTLLDRAKVARLAALKPSAVEISIYGMRSATHDSITRRKGSLRKSLRAALLLRAAGIPVAIKSPMLAGTDDAHFELIDAARRIGAGFQIDPSLITRHDGDTQPLQVRPDIDTVAKLFSDPRLNKGVTTLEEPRPDDEAPCAIGRRVVRIAANGDVFPCSSFPIAAGNLREASLASIWRESPVLNEIRRFTNADLQDECNGCGRRGYCGRCSAQALMEQGNFRGPSVEACNRAEARERALGVAPPANARRVADAVPLGRRKMDSLIPLASLTRKSGQASRQ